MDKSSLQVYYARAEMELVYAGLENQLASVQIAQGSLLNDWCTCCTIVNCFEYHPCMTASHHLRVKNNICNAI